MGVGSICGGQPPNDVRRPDDSFYGTAGTTRICSSRDEEKRKTYITGLSHCKGRMAPLARSQKNVIMITAGIADRMRCSFISFKDILKGERYVRRRRFLIAKDTTQIHERL